MYVKLDSNKSNEERLGWQCRFIGTECCAPAHHTANGDRKQIRRGWCGCKRIVVVTKREEPIQVVVFWRWGLGRRKGRGGAESEDGGGAFEPQARRPIWVLRSGQRDSSTNEHSLTLHTEETVRSLRCSEVPHQRFQCADDGCLTQRRGRHSPASTNTTLGNTPICDTRRAGSLYSERPRHKSDLTIYTLGNLSNKVADEPVLSHYAAPPAVIVQHYDPEFGNSTRVCDQGAGCLR